MNKDAKPYIAGHTGLVGAALFSKCKEEGYKNIVVKLHKELDLTRQLNVEKFFQNEQPQYVILSAAKVGGIHDNITHPAQFIYERPFS
jgi:GDP-L-fucose synthase